MIYKKYVLNQIKETLDKLGPLDRCDSKKICQGLGVDADVLVYVLFNHLDKVLDELYKCQKENEELADDNVRLKKSLNNKYKGNKRDIQAALVSGGMPIAKKSKKSWSALRLRLYLGATDEELLEEYGISKVTLWRWKKELAEKEAAGQRVLD